VLQIPYIRCRRWPHREDGDKSWGQVAGGFAIAWPFAFAVNRAMIGRGKGHAVVYEYHH
jgi:hypothetical protein